MLQSYEGVVAAETGHVSVHEAGAIEFSGHKVLTIPSHLGKIDVAELSQYVENFYNDGNHENMVFPGMVYISQPTEYGTLYTLDELTGIREICDKHQMHFFIDGARLGYGLASRDADVTLQDIARLSDVFYIGGTKIGALIGEAVVFTKETPSHFVTRIKQHGALLAKGRLLGIQFSELFTNDLYMSISRHAIDMAEQVKELLHEYNFKFYLESPTNQLFVILHNDDVKRLSEHVRVGFWESYDADHTVVRFATSWSTTQAHIDELRIILGDFGNK